MKTNFKKATGLIVSLAIAGSTSVISAGAYEISFSRNGVPVFEHGDVIRFVCEDTQLEMFMYNGKGTINVVNNKAEIEEKYSSVMNQTNQFFWVKDEEPYLISFHDGTENIDSDFKFDVVCDIDFSNRVIRDYETKDEIQPLDTILIRLPDSEGYFWFRALETENGECKLKHLITVNSVEELDEFIERKTDYSYDTFDDNIMQDTLLLKSDYKSVGDVNEDGTVDLTDLSELSLVILGESELTDSQKSAADINGDGEVNVSDLARLKQFVSNKINSI